MLKKILFSFVFCLAVVAWQTFTAAADEPSETIAFPMEKFSQLQQQGNFNEALDLAKEYFGQQTPEKCKNIFEILQQTINCMNRVNRIAEADDFLETVVAKFPNDSRTLQAVGKIYGEGFLTPYGFRVDNQFKRGQNRSGGQRMIAQERDRIRGLQLLTEAEKNLGQSDYSDEEKGQFYIDFANAFMNHRGGSGSWELQTLTDISKLPDYQSPENYYGRRYYGRPNSSAPVDEEGNPVFYAKPESFDAAKSDGERWRFLLDKAEQFESSKKMAMTLRADFAYQQFGVHTIAGFNFNPANDTGDDKMSSIFKLETLSDMETIARLATGIKRFNLPEDYNYIELYKELDNWSQLGQIYLNRRQFPTAAVYWKKGADQGDDWAKRMYEQIVNPWGRIVSSRQEDLSATISFLYRNATTARFKISRIDVDALIKDAKDEILMAREPRNIHHDYINIDNIAYRLILRHQKKYIKEDVEKWDQTLEPTENHFDKQIDMDIAFPEAGAYLIEAIVAGGNTHYAVVWINNTVLVKKSIDNKFWFFVADSNTGKALPYSVVDFFGYSFRYSKQDRKQQILKDSFFVTADANGQFTVPQEKFSSSDGYSWLITVKGQDGKHQACQGFRSFWGYGAEFANQYDQQYNAVRVFSMTDRPVYRPAQKVQFKFWARRSQYDKDGSDFANTSATLVINNPRGEELLRKDITFDEFGGYADEIELASDAMLGGYSISVRNPGARLYGGGYFRVEEYRKPEFQVEVKAPEKPVALGEKINATVKAKYYFGEPVSHAKAKIKVTRSEYNERWFPTMPWDWLFGRGYWWFSYEYPWYPGWNSWGCVRPYPSWHHFPHNPPEVVYEKEVDLKDDGTYDVEIDTEVAKMIFGDQNQQYDVSVEVTDASRRTINGSGKVLVSAKPFTVCAWTDRGVYHVSDPITVSFKTQTLDNKPVSGNGTLKIYQVSYKSDGSPEESEVWSKYVNPEEDGSTVVTFNLKKAGQYRIEYSVDDGANHVCKGGQLITLRGDGFNSKDYRFADLEIVPEKDTCNPGETLRLTINVDKTDAVVWLFPRAANGVCLPPEKVEMNGKTGYYDLKIEMRDMPNFFVEAVTVANNQVFTETRQICVPPAKRILVMDVIPSKENYKPGEDATAKIVLKDLQGNPFVGQAVVTIYDKSLEYISGGSNVGDISSFFWNWKRSHHPSAIDNSLKTYLQTAYLENAVPMETLGIFGNVLKQDFGGTVMEKGEFAGRGGGKARANVMAAGAVERKMFMAAPMAAEAPMMMNRAMDGADMMVAEEAAADDVAMDADAAPAEAEELEAETDKSGAKVQATVRTNFADSAYWTGAIVTNENGEAEISLKMPENLTTWKIKAWAMGKRTEVGQAETEVITRKNLIIRAQTPRFLVQADKIVLSAIVHNYLESEKSVEVKVETGDNLATEDKTSQEVNIAAGGETRVDWTFTAKSEGDAVVRMFALTDEESDAMEVKFPIITHGILKQDSFSGAVRSQDETASQAVEFTVPQERKPEQTRLEVRFSPTLAGAMFDAVPYLVDYPYGCTEQTLNRFLPAAICQKVVRDMGVDISELEQKTTNLNAQEIGDAAKRAAQWKKTQANPVFNPNELDKIVKFGIGRLTDMQCSDGGWGWFSGYGEHSSAHTTAVVVHGLTIAQQSDVKVDANVLKRGVDWLERYEAEQVELLQRGDKVKENPKLAKEFGYRYKTSADNLDALVYTVLIESGRHNATMGEFIYRDRLNMSPYALALMGLGFDMTEQNDKRDMVVRNLTQFLRQDDENQTAWLDLGGTPFWYWYGSEIETQAWYLKLLCRTGKTEEASRLVKYLLNNRKHATYWNSTRDTALVLEAFAEYLRKTDEMAPDMTVDVVLDGKTVKTVKIDKENLFSFDGTFVLEGEEITEGKHTLELKRTGSGPLYFNAYVNYFTLEDFIPASGLEIKVQRKYYKLVRDESATENAVGSHGQAVEVKIDKYVRQELKVGDVVKSGDIILVDLTLESKNDYEYLVFEDKKPAGFEPMDVRSGYNGNEIGAYVEFRDQKVSFFCRTLARGKCSVSYKLKAETPGVVSALPATGEAMYAPELKANSDEFKIETKD
ncbi:MAG: alpha-2-macroglobulin [Thermoguttaceae bacterium]|nr:alpha-2-macroglobulin [Thermoguttaceae bacterium]